MRTTKPYMLGFIGCGHMGMAIARGCAASDYIERFRILVYDHHEENMKMAKEERFGLAASEKEVAEKAHIVVLAMTPAKADDALNAIKDAHPECILSIVTGLSISHIEEILGTDTMVIRAMPNTPLQIQAGATALCMSPHCKADEYDFVYKMFDEMGTARTIPEEQMNTIVAVSGSVPAYVYYFAQCIIDDAKARGVDAESARALLVQTMIGSAELLGRNTRRPFEDFVNEVATKGGTTIEAINAFKEKDLAGIVHEANERCIRRAEELSK